MKENMCPFSISLLILTVKTTVLHGIVLKYYTLSWSNCGSFDTFITKSTPSIVVCALFCTQYSVCKSFAWGNGVCGLRNTQSRCCGPAIDGEDGLNIYKLKGKIYSGTYGLISILEGRKGFHTRRILLFLTLENLNVRKGHDNIWCLLVHLR